MNVQNIIMRLTYIIYSEDESSVTYEIKLNNDDVTITFPFFDFTINHDHEFLKFHYMDENHDSNNIQSPELFLNKFVIENRGYYRFGSMGFNITDDKIHIGNVTIKRNEELVNDIIKLFTDINKKMYILSNKTGLEQLKYYIKQKMNLGEYKQKYNEAFKKLFKSKYCSNEFKEAYKKAIIEHGKSAFTI